MELVEVIKKRSETPVKVVNPIVHIATPQPLIVENSINQNFQFIQKPFIEANTKEVLIEELKNDCIIPVFSRDNERTISHQEFIDIAYDCTSTIFSNHQIDQPEIRVSHQIKGRTADAIYKPVKELLDHERTQYFERMAFIIRIPSITANINGNNLALTVGGVRSYNHENLYSKKSIEKFKFFIGFQNMVCCNLCISTDGFSAEMRVSSYRDLRFKIVELIKSYSTENHLDQMKQLSDYTLTEQQFAQLIGKSRLYNYLPKKEKQQIPELLLNDGQISTIAKHYYQDEAFCKDEQGSINLWNVYNLFTGANKSSYIDSFLNRGTNAFEFTKGLKNAICGDSNHSWFLS